MSAIKRNLQEMYGLNGETTDASDAKKTRIDNNRINMEPSRVVHLRSLPLQINECEVIYLGLYFGNIVNVLFLRGKSQAFLEFDQLDDAQKMITHFNTNQILFNGKKIYVQYSNHQALTTDPNMSNNQQAQQTLENAKQLHACAKIGGKNTVLRATVLNPLYPVTFDVIQQIFSKFGAVLKIIMFNKNDKFQILIQMKDGNAAQQAKQSLHGQNIYNGCCTLQIEFSKLLALEIRFNNDKSRDYTNLLLPSSEQNSNTNELNILLPGYGISNNNNGMSNNNNAFCNLNGTQMNPFAQVQQGIIGAAPNLLQAAAAAASLNAASLPTYLNQNLQNQTFNLAHNQLGVNANGSNTNLASNNGGMNGNIGSVVLVSNLNEEFVTPEALFTLFGVYGDVLRVKILFNKKDNALIQFTNPQHASTALQYLDRCKLWNKTIRVFPSKHLNVQMPKDGTQDAGLTKDFTNSPLHRFKKPGSKNFNNIFPPSQTLHLSNIPASVEEKDLRELFGQYGCVKNFKFFQKDRKMALIQMETIEEAVHALIGTHNHQLADNMHLRCTFSKATI